MENIPEFVRGVKAFEWGRTSSDLLRCATARPKAAPEVSLPQTFQFFLLDASS